MSPVTIQFGVPGTGEIALALLISPGTFAVVGVGLYVVYQRLSS